MSCLFYLVNHRKEVKTHLDPRLVHVRHQKKRFLAKGELICYLSFDLGKSAQNSDNLKGKLLERAGHKAVSLTSRQTD